MRHGHTAAERTPPLYLPTCMLRQIVQSQPRSTAAEQKRHFHCQASARSPRCQLVTTETVVGVAATAEGSAGAASALRRCVPAAMFACSRMRSPISLERRREQPKQEAELPANRSQSEEGATSSLAVGEDTLLVLRGVKSSSHALPLLELLGDSSSRSHELITAAASSRGPSTTNVTACCSPFLGRVWRWV